MNSRRRCRARRQRGHLSFKLVPRAKLVPYPVSLRLVFAVARGPMIVALRPAVFDRYALALNETGFPQAIAKRGYIKAVGATRCAGTR